MATLPRNSARLLESSSNTVSSSTSWMSLTALKVPDQFRAIPQFPIVQSEGAIPVGTQCFVFGMSLSTKVDELEHTEGVRFAVQVSGCQTISGTY